MQADFRIEAVEEALARCGRPEGLDTDQGPQFTSTGFTKVPPAKDIKTGMDGRSARRDNVSVERLWKSAKDEKVYLRACVSVGEACASIRRHLDFCNRRRPHSSAGRKAPDRACSNQPCPAAA